MKTHIFLDSLPLSSQFSLSLLHGPYQHNIHHGVEFYLLPGYLVHSCLSLKNCKFYKGQDQVCYLRSLVFPGLQCLDKMCPEIYEWMSEMINIDE